MIWSTLLSIFGGALQNYQKVQAVKAEAKMEIIRAEAKAVVDADVASIRAQKYSVKDEILMFVLLGPFIGAFVPGLQPYVKEGFEVLESLPLWYQAAIIGIVITVFGLRFMVSQFWRK